MYNIFKFNLNKTNDSISINLLIKNKYMKVKT